MRVHVHTKFCFLCVLTFLFHQCNHCHGEGHSHQHDGHHHADHNHVHSDLQISEAPYVRGATLTPGARSTQGHSLEEEQRFYIQQLFRRYGQKDRLDFQGFQSLLFSLGLGEVKVVDVDHEDLGHDHVAHLDLLDVQEGLHTHSSTSEGHSQGHGHGHGHPRHKPGSHHPHTEQVPTRCSQDTTAASPAAGDDHKHDHDHAKVEVSDHKHSDGHVQGAHDHDHPHDHDHTHDTEHKREQVHSNHKDLSSQPHSDHQHDRDHVHEAQTGTDIPPINLQQQPSPQLEPPRAPQELQSSPATAESRPKKPRKPARARGQRGRGKTPSPVTPESDDHDHQHEHSHDLDRDHGHSHKDKREARRGSASPTLPVPVLSAHPGGLFHQHEEVGLV